MAKGKEGYKVRTIECVSCGKTATGRLRPQQKYCTLECYRNHGRPTRMTGEDRPCQVCGKLSYFVAKRIEKTKTFFCSPEHANEWQGRGKDSYICKVCGEVFKWSPSRKTTQNPIYCTLKCRDADPDTLARLIDMNVQQSRGKTNKLELAGYAILDDIGTPYSKQELLFGKFCVDAVYPAQKVVVQFDGDYWHGHPSKFPTPDARQIRRMNMDKSQDAYLTKAGYVIVRAWETDVKNAANAVKSLIEASIQAALPAAA